jgi:hypothetical protein
MLVLDVGSSTMAAGHVDIPRPVPRNSNSSRGQRPSGDWSFGLHGAPRSDSHFGFFSQRSIWVYSPSFSGVRFIRGAGHAHVHGWIRQYESIATGCGRHSFAGRNTLGIQQLPPTGGGKRDHARLIPVPGEQREDLALSTWMRRVVPNVHDPDIWIGR